MAKNYTPENITDIYWAYNNGFKVGRDPMGIENSSVATYGRLLPGITNQTRHIRYYSFYCWLLNEYDLNQQQRYKEVPQYNFVRRAELAMAYLMKDRGINAIPGSNHFAHWNDQETYECNLKADGDREGGGDRYWTWPTGALGQYYVGSLINLKLVRMVNSRFYVLDRGKELAEAYRNSVPLEARESFIECIKKGRITIDDIPDLEPLVIDGIIDGSEEYTALKNILFSQDEDGSTMRKETIDLFLKAVNDKGVKYRDFPSYMYRHWTSEYDKGARFGWYFYFMNEAMHYAQETIFLMILEKADKNNYHPLPSFISNCVAEILQHMQKGIENDTLEDILPFIEEDVATRLEEVRTSVAEHKYELAASQAVWLMSRVWIEVSPNLLFFERFEDDNDLKRQRGILTEALKEYVSNHLNDTIEQTVRSLIHQVMNDHTIAAYEKMGRSGDNLCKFMVEDGCIVHIETMYPNLTNPRTQSLYDILVDLGFITRA